MYLDLSFFRALSERFRAPGDFAQAYVIAHEVGHHVQALLGVTDRVAAARQRGTRSEANVLSVRLQRQAQGRIAPDSFTHGRSEQRSRWFRRGFDTGELRRCDTFAASAL